MVYKLTSAERETVIRRAADERQWSVFTEDPVVIRKLDRLFEATDVTAHGKRYELPLAALSFRQPRKLTGKQLEVARSRMAKVGQNASLESGFFAPGRGPLPQPFTRG